MRERERERERESARALIPLLVQPATRHRLSHHSVKPARVARAVRTEVARAQERDHLRHIRLSLSLALHFARGLQCQATAELLSLASVRNIFDVFFLLHIFFFFFVSFLICLPVELLGLFARGSHGARGAALHLLFEERQRGV